MMLAAITGSALISALGAVCIVIGLGMYVVPPVVAWYDRHRDPDGAHALARKHRKERAS